MFFLIMEVANVKLSRYVFVSFQEIAFIKKIVIFERGTKPRWQIYFVLVSLKTVDCFKKKKKKTTT